LTGTRCFSSSNQFRIVLIMLRPKYYYGRYVNCPIVLDPSFS
jgi:hypothetical protein